MPTPSPVINGQLGAHEQPWRYGYDQSGPYFIQSWHGTRSAIAAQYSLCVAAGAICEVRQGIGVDILEARFGNTDGAGGGGEQVVNTWEFFANTLEKDILEADQTSIAAVTEANRGVIRHRLDNPGEDPAMAFVADGTQTTAEALWKLMLKGVRAVRVLQPILRHTQTVISSYTIKASLTNVGKILTNAQITSLEDMPLSVLFNLPADGVAKTGYTWGWYKCHPTARTAVGQKVQIEQEWEYGHWETSLLYSVAS
jgi:hypothetical protein